MSLLASSSDAGTASVVVVIYLALFVLAVVGFWKVFTKAGEAGWKSIIPFYNVYTLLKIVGRPGWWLILFLIPFVNFVIWIIVALDLAKSYGKGTGFAIGLIFLSFIFILILGFGDARYVGPGGTPTLAGSPPPPPPMPGSTPPPPPPPPSA
jgi:hypothetical protein